MNNEKQRNQQQERSQTTETPQTQKTDAGRLDMEEGNMHNGRLGGNFDEEQKEKNSEEKHQR